MIDSQGGARVLVVDDDANVTALLKRLLMKDDYVVDVASNGASALAAIAARLPDVILLDVVMPDVDGFTLCRRLKADAVTRFIPVILVTGLGDQDKRVEGAESGADEFL